MRYDYTDVVKQEIETALMYLYTTIPAIVTSYNATTQKVDVNVAVETPTYDGENIAPPSLTEVPVMFPSASNWVIAGPILVGDSVTLLVPHYATESYTSGKKDKIGKPKLVKRHDINQAVAMVGMFTTKPTRKEEHKDKFHIAQGDNVITFDDSGGISLQNGSGVINMPASGPISITGDVNITGNLNVTGTTTTVGLVGNGVNHITHTHGYTDDGSPQTTSPPA